MNKSIFLIIVLAVLVSCNRPVRQPVELVEPSESAEPIEVIKTPQTRSVITLPTNTQRPTETNHNEHCYIHGKIIRIVDGDTAELLYGELPIKLRLEHIDAPEKRGSQPYGNKAKQQLSDLCFGQSVCIVGEGEMDRYGRLIGVIINESGVNVNKQMVLLGYAWHYKKYSNDMSYDELERQARANKSGLWIGSNPVAPWNYR